MGGEGEGDWVAGEGDGEGDGDGDEESNDSEHVVNPELDGFVLPVEVGKQVEPAGGRVPMGTPGPLLPP